MFNHARMDILGKTVANVAIVKARQDVTISLDNAFVNLAPKVSGRQLT